LVFEKSGKVSVGSFGTSPTFSSRERVSGEGHGASQFSGKDTGRRGLSEEVVG